MEKPSFEYVYFIRAQGTNLIKIGRTTSLQDRLNTLQTGCPHQLELIIAVAHPDSPSIEKRLHQKFERYGTTGEWFALSEDIIRSLELFSELFGERTISKSHR